MNSAKNLNGFNEINLKICRLIMSGFLEYKFKNLRQNTNIINFAFENLHI